MKKTAIITSALVLMLTGAVSCTKNSPETTPEIPDIPATDLSSGEAYANCYIVPSAGTYSFAARHVDGTEITGIESADWLWSTCDNAPDGLVSDVTYSNGIVRFTASAAKGNAVIAAFGKSGNLVWSWHVWLSDTPQHQQLDNGTAFMDRNLGAESAAAGDGPATYGLKYQWGRKDPFYGGDRNETSRAFSCADGHVVFNPKHNASWKAVESDGTTGTVEYAISHPMSFIYSTDNAVKDWLQTKNSYLWAARNTGAKTNYDPCPAGYQVPSDTAWKGVRFDNTFEKDGGKSHVTSDGTEFWWPLCGTRWGDTDAGKLGYVYMKTGEVEGGQGIYWQNTTNMAGTNACCFYLLSGTYVDAGHAMYRAHGCAVRCEYVK